MDTTILYTRHGTDPYAGKVERDERGKPFYRYQERCHRCGGAGGADKWKHTGWTCFDCGGNGKGPIVRAPLYTAEQIAKLNAAAAKREAARQAKAKAAEEARRAPFLAWESQHEHVLGQIRTLGRQDWRTRIANDCAAFHIPPAWVLDCAIMDIVRDGVQQDMRDGSQHIGTPGARLEVELTCERVLDYGDKWQPFYIALMRDGAGNRVVYKGSRPPLGKDQSGRYRVTIKEHGERDGEKQTIIARPIHLDDLAAATKQLEPTNGR